MKHSKQILSITSAAVDALSNARDVHKEKRAEFREGLEQATSSVPITRKDVTHLVSSRHPSPFNLSLSSSTADDQISDQVNREVKDQTSSSLSERSFNGTRRVRVPSRLLREIKSPLERSSPSGDSKETPGVIRRVDEQMRPTPVKVIRHVNGPSAWILSQADDLHHNAKPPDPVKTVGEPSVDDAASGMILQRAEESRLTEKQVTEDAVRHLEDDTRRTESYQRTKNAPIKGLFQGQPKYGVPVFNPREENTGDVKVKQFVLNDKERALKEQFLKRPDQKRPVKKLVQPTVVSPVPEEERKMQGGMNGDNPVATAAAIAAAAASAATGPFLQLQHSLEAQVAALVSNLQVLQQNHDRQQEIQDKEKESKLQQQIEERLKRLEDLQTKMLEVQSAPVSYPTGSLQPSVMTHPSGMVPPGHVTAATHNPVPSVSSRHDAPGTVLRDDLTQPQYTVAGHYQPHTTHESPHDLKDLFSHPGSIPAIEKHKVVRNTRTQTSPQESISSEEPPLQTPLPRKRPPIPMSRYDLPRSRAKGPRSDADRRAEKKARVRFESDVTPRLQSYRREMTHKGRGLVKELVSHAPAFRGDQTGMKHRTLPDSNPVLPLRSETVALSNDVGKIKTELRDILTETERLKQELVQHQLAKDDVPSHLLPTRHTGPSPLDEYLETTHVSSHQPRNPMTSRPSGFLPTNSTRHFADAERILEDVQHRRQNLDYNLETVIRQREEQDLYNLVDNIPVTNSEFDEMLRIRREVDKKIGEITSAVQREIDQEAKGISLQNEEKSALKKQKAQPVKATPYVARRIEQKSTTRPGSITGKKAADKTTGKENVPEKIAARKGKPTRAQAPPKRPTAVTPAQKQVYLSSVYGRQPYHPQRTTSKAPYLHYQSPVNPKTAAIMAGIMAGDSKVAGKPVLQDLTSVPEKDVTEPRQKKAAAVKPELSPRVQPTKRNNDTQYFFHPRVDLSQVAPGEGKAMVAVPLEGQLVPMAIPLGKPKTDPALRPPIATQAAQHTSPVEVKAESSSTDSTISTDTSETPPPDPTPLRPRKPTRPNVAVITMYDKELGENTAHQHKRQKKSPAKKKQSSLSVQVLPKVDIDSFSESGSSMPSLPHVSDIPEPLSRPDGSEYQEFRNFLAVTESGTREQHEEQALDDDDDDADDDVHRIPTPQHPLTLEGFTGVQDQPYNGPPFPPVHPPDSVQLVGGVLEADTRQEEALQERAMEWIEQELLARIVSEMNQPAPDPTTLIRPQSSPDSSTVSEPEDEDADMLAATIGLGGIQLFIDAGLPVDRELVTNLIREVIAENISTILGHPKPRASSVPSRHPALGEEHPSHTPSPRVTPLPTPAPTPEYTPPESEESAHESGMLATPERTPTPSVTSEEATLTDTKEEENVFEPIHEEVPKEEQTSDQISEVRTPVSTPVPSPPAAQSPAVSVSTPEPSVREPELSQGTVVPTPPPSVVVKTPTPEPEPEPEFSIAEEPSQPTEPSVSQKVLTHPKPAQPSISSPSSVSSTTLGTTTITTEEEMSEGEMIQPYVHTGIYSEGEFAVSPTIVQLAAQRKLPVSGDWDTAVLGQDEDSRNVLVRAALNGILQDGKEGKRRNSSSSISESMYQVSSASTLRDTEDIREDSITDVTHSEGEVPVQDPMAVLLSRIQNHMRSAENSMASEGELLTEHLRTPNLSQDKRGKRNDGETAPGNISPGEIVGEPPGIMRELHPTSADFTLDNVAGDKEQISKTAVHEVAPSAVDGGPSHDDWSLHVSDLMPGTLGTDQDIASPAFTLQQRSKPRVIHVEERESEASGSHSQKTYSLEERRREITAPNKDNEKQAPADVGGLDLASTRSGVSEPEAREMEPQQPTKIQVTLPSIDDIHEESSLASEHPVSIEQDTFGDVSSISGGDF